MSRIEDVATAAGVSTATVSRALRGLPKVSPDTRQRVLEAAEQLRYVVSPTASSLASGRTGVVAVVVPFITRWYFGQLLAGATEALGEQGYHVLLFDMGDEGPGRADLLDQRMFLKRVDAVLVLSLRMHAAELEMLRGIQLPVTTVGVTSPDLSCVRIDDVEVVTTATEHLLGLGHECVAFVGRLPGRRGGFQTPSDREAGFRAAMQRRGLPVADWQVQEGEWTPSGGFAAGLRLLGRDAGSRPTAVVAASDELAIGVLGAARELGVAVPGQLSVTGIDDHEMAAVHGLTTVAQPVADQGRQAAGVLLDMLAGGSRTAEVHTVATRLVVRGTTAPPTAASPPRQRRARA